MPKKKISKGGKNDNLPMILVILDGWGIDKPNKGNAVTIAKTPTMDGLMRHYPSTMLLAHGKYAGLPLKQVGNSEAGHMNIGAGRLVEQDSVKITKSINDGTFKKNSAFLGAIRHAKRWNSKLHLIGMLSNGQSPHSDPNHLAALINLAKKHEVKKIYLHLFTDGRDSPMYASLKLFDDLEKTIAKDIPIVSVIGRFYAMDRKKKWVRTEKAYEALVYGKGRQAASVSQAITESYNRSDSDEYIEPYIIEYSKNENTRVENKDSVIFFNLRSDRSRQLAKAFVQTNFKKMNPGAFMRSERLKHLYFVAMTDFGPDLDDILTAFPSVDLKNTLPMQLKDLKQLYVSETEKFAHVTFFMNGGYSGTVAGEDQINIPSPDVKSYDQTPAMSSEKLAKKVISNIKKNVKLKKWIYDFTLLNIAAPDMIGHTGNLSSAIECCHTTDRLVGKIVKAYLGVNGTVIITADHGNIENMIDLNTGELHTEHTTNKVPFIVINKRLKNKIKLKNGGMLGNIAPTILKLLNRKKPKEMNRRSLI